MMEEMDISLAGVSDVALKAELDRRKRVIEDKALKHRVAQWQFFIDNAQAILPWMDHGRTTCSDMNPVNYFSHDNGYPLCNKCFLLQVVDYKLPPDILAEKHYFQMSIQVEPFNIDYP